MTIIDKFVGSDLLFSIHKKKGFRLRTKLLVGLIPSVMIILAITGYTTYLTSSHFLNQALERTSRFQAKAMAHEIEALLETCKQTLCVIAQTSEDFETTGKNFSAFLAATGIEFRGLGFISQKDRAHGFFVAKEGRIVQLSGAELTGISPDPLFMLENLATLKKNEVWISPFMEVQLPFPSEENPNQKILSRVIYFGTPWFTRQGEHAGFFLMCLDVRCLRNILSLFNSSKSPVWAFPRTPELRFAYLFDPSGWILFQSEAVEKPDLELATDQVRSGYTDGTLSKPGLPAAFRPGSAYQHFWKMIGDINDGNVGLLQLKDSARYSVETDGYYLAYAPVVFQGKVMAGIAYVDRTRQTRTAGYKHMDIMLILSLATIAGVSMIILILSHIISKPIYQLSEAVNDIQKSRKLKPIDIGSSEYEANLLEHGINNMISAISTQLAELKIKELKIQHVEHKEKMELKAQPPLQARRRGNLELREIIGFGEKIEQVKSDIIKAAGSDEDVLIIGETGTGKQLAAEAIHRHSKRANAPFISVNCGELAENLLIDSLFGHIKGAFTEAKSDRKGAFLEADGGTLFLDEIQTASPTVQQALLRSVAMRKIKPLGSDRDVDVDVRLITATNVDLRVLIENRQFRNDLYYRLKVITIFIPPLRSQMETIPVIIDHFLHLLRETTGRKELGISKGAMKKISEYHWPGNIRELKNCITRAAVMSENDIIQAEDIFLDGEFHVELSRITSPLTVWTGIPEERIYVPEDDPLPHPDGRNHTDDIHHTSLVKMNFRQQKAYAYLLEHKSITRSEYQTAVGVDVSSRTAIYDLQDFVKKGVLKKEGKGPATRYILIE